MDFGKNWKILYKNFVTVISNGPGFKLFTLNQVIEDVNC